MDSRRFGLRLVWLPAVALLMSVGCTRTDVVDPDSNPDTNYLISDALGGRDNGSEGSRLAQDHIINRMKDWAVGANKDAEGTAAYHQDFAVGSNIIAIIPGTDLADEYVMLGAHYDGLGSGSECDRQTSGDMICNGATDNAVGVGMVLEVAERLANADADERPRRSVVIAFWDAEEDGLLGSKAFMANPLFSLEDVVAYVNVDMQGSNLRRSVASTTFAIGAETGGPFLTEAVRRAAEPGPLDTRLLSLIFGMGRSDHAVFAEAGLPVVFLTDSTGPCYHTVEDDGHAIDWIKAQSQSATLFRLMVDLTRNADGPTPVPDAPTMTYADALELSEVMADLRSGSGEFTKDGHAKLLERGEMLDRVIAAGPDAFDASAQGDLTVGAIDLIELLVTGRCDAFRPER